MATITAVSVLHEELKDAHTALQATLADVTNEVAAYIPPGKANPIAGTYAHLVMSEDFFMQGMLKKSKPLFETEWKDKTGASEVQPTDWETAFPKWLKDVTVDMTAFNAYAKAVFSSSEEYVASMKDEDLGEEIDLSMFGMGMRPISSFLGSLIIAHARDIHGEISVLKGIQGLKGYPW